MNTISSYLIRFYNLQKSSCPMVDWSDAFAGQLIFFKPNKFLGAVAGISEHTIF